MVKQTARCFAQSRVRQEGFKQVLGSESMRSIPRTAFALVVPLVLGGMVVVDADEQAAGKKSGDEDSTTVITTITTTKVEKPDEPGTKPEDPKKTKEQDPATKQAAVRKAKASRKAVVKAKMPAVVDPEKVKHVH